METKVGGSKRLEDLQHPSAASGDPTKLAVGYGRNYLLPGKLAIEATPANKAVIEQMKSSAIRKAAKEKSQSEELSKQMQEVELVFERKVGENDHLFGSVTSGDIAQQLEAKGFKIDRRKISLEDPLRTVGEFHVPIKLHREVTTHVKVIVVRDESTVPSTEQTEAQVLPGPSGRIADQYRDEFPDVLASAVRVWGDRRSASEWLKSPHYELHGKTPESLLETRRGRQRVEDLLGALEHGFPV
jgi:large subunit ribosomal protein L9